MYALTTGEADCVMRLVDVLRNGKHALGNDSVDFKIQLNYEDWLRLVKMRESLGLRLK